MCLHNRLAKFRLVPLSRQHSAGCLASSAQHCASAEEAKQMRNVLDSILATGSAQAVCCQLAACTSFQAFEMLCAQCEHRGLVFVPSGDPQQKLGEVFYDRDTSWQHELVSGNLSHILGVKLGGLAGEAPSDMLVACLQLTCCNPLQPCVPLAAMFRELL